MQFFLLNASHDKSVFVFSAKVAELCPHEVETTLQTRCNSYEKTHNGSLLLGRHNDISKPSSYFYEAHSFLSNAHALEIIS
jgi:hypothetical protein